MRWSIFRVYHQQNRLREVEPLTEILPQVNGCSVIRAQNHEAKSCCLHPECCTPWFGPNFIRCDPDDCLSFILMTSHQTRILIESPESLQIIIAYILLKSSIWSFKYTFTKEEFYEYCSDPQPTEAKHNSEHFLKQEKKTFILHVVLHPMDNF